ncbi:MAG: universal stress protein [Cyanophyceae cyanobacterium]
MTFQNILVAIDRSPQGEAVFKQALAFAKHNEAHLTLFYCLPTDSEGVGSYSDMYGQELTNFSKAIAENKELEVQAVEQWLGQYQQQASEQGVSIEYRYHAGNTDRAICDLARDQNIDLIVLGRRGRKGIEEMLLGSVSNYVVHHAPCSVLVVQGSSD